MRGQLDGHDLDIDALVRARCDLRAGSGALDRVHIAMRPLRAVSNFIVQALNNQPLTIYGDGLQTRSFCFVDDLVRGMIGLMNSPDGISGPINCGNPNEFTIRDLADKVIAMTGSRSRMVHRPLPQDDPRQRRPDISQAQKLLDWRPTVMLTEGLQRTIAYFEK